MLFLILSQYLQQQNCTSAKNKPQQMKVSHSQNEMTVIGIKCNVSSLSPGERGMGGRGGGGCLQSGYLIQYQLVGNKTN
jgi:hypothetical protein